MKQENRISYRAGITRTPSDFLCQDGELAECINLTTDNEELKPMVQPAVYIASAVDMQGMATDIPTILYVHKFNDEERYVGYVTVSIPGGTVNYLVCGKITDHVFTSIRGFLYGDYSSSAPQYIEGSSITSIGKTLIISNSGGIQYYLWGRDGDDEIYKALGRIPDHNVKFYLRHAHALERGSHVSEGLQSVSNSGSFEGILSNSGTYVPGQGWTGNWQVDQQEDYNNLVTGLYAKNRKAAARKRGFCEPFLLRTALEMYDGSYTNISQPILMFPSVSMNSYVNFWAKDMGLNTHFSVLQYLSNTVDFGDWTDLIKDIVVFVSDGIAIYDTVSDQNVPSPVRDLWDGIGTEARQTDDSQSYIIHSLSSDGAFSVLKKVEPSEIADSLASCSVFYKLCSIGLGKTDIHEHRYASEHIHSHTIENLTTQERLPNDDYYSRTILYAAGLYAYNSRLNLASVSRSFFEGFDDFIAFDNDGEATYTFYVTIKTDGGQRVVSHTKATRRKQGIYFYYPDPRASHVKIFKGSLCILDADLKEHPGLNGAYYLRTDYDNGLGGYLGNEPAGFESIAPEVSNDPERLPNHIVTSEVNNPWVFRAEGYNKVGTGRIIGVSTTTQALSQGQFGQYPLLVFSESGIWAMAVDDTGLYKSVSPMSRDVCINPDSILQTDGAVFFVSKKGLMVVAGNEVRCVSERMNGEAFNTGTLSPLATGTEWQGIVTACQNAGSFLEYVRSRYLIMAYDYTDSRIIMHNPAFGFSFVYSIADGSVSKAILPAAMTHVVNNYPDYLMQGRIQGGQACVYSFYEKPREEEVQTRSLAFLLTRPMKLGGPVGKSSLRELANVGSWMEKDAQGSELSCVKTEVYLSDDMCKWFRAKSRFGAAAKYWRLALYIRMLPTERLSGTIMEQQQRRTNNQRT